MPAQRCLALVALSGLAVGVLGSGPAVAAPASPVRISAVLFDGVLKGDPEPESCVRLTNTDAKRTVSLDGYAITDELTPRRMSAVGGVSESGEGFLEEGAPREGAGNAKGRGSLPRVVELGAAGKLKPGQQVWVAHQGKAFLEVFGYLPDFEAVDTLAEVPNVDAPRGWIRMPAEHGTAALKDGFGEVVDFVAYDTHKEPRYAERDLPERYWKGPPVRLYNSSPFGWTGQILARDRDEGGRITGDTDTAADWDSGFSRKKLGEDPVHRVWLPGQSEFVARRLDDVPARVWATSAPDNNYSVLLEAFEGAEQRIWVSVYQFTNVKVADALIDAKKRGVDVRLWLEGSPVGGIPDEERYVADRMARAGISVHFLASDPKANVRPRYRFDHSKYVIIDDRRVIIGTENYGRTGVPAHPTYGNRGWMIHIEQPELVRQLKAVWAQDYRPGFRDVVSIHDSPSDTYGLPYKDPRFAPDDTLQRGLYVEPRKPVYVSEKMSLELVLSPDTSLNENTSIIGMMRRAKSELLLQQNSVRRRWGEKSDSVETTPNLPLEAVVEAARRGVRVRVLLDGTWYNVQGDEDRDNDDTVAFLNQLARDEGLDVSAKIINLATTHLEKIHAKGIIVDGREVFVGSINWTENSFKGNREVGVIVEHDEVAGYYRDLFLRDWSESRMYEVRAVRGTEVLDRADRKGRAVERVATGRRLTVVGEHRGQGNDPAWLEVRLALGKTGFVRFGHTGAPEASPGEAVHLVGRDAEIVGRVMATRVTSKVIQLKLDDEKRPPFMAVVFQQSAPRFEEAGLNPAQAFQGRRVRVRGRVSSYKVPEIVVRGPEQLMIVDEGER